MLCSAHLLCDFLAAEAPILVEKLSDGIYQSEKMREIWEHVITTCSLLPNVKLKSMFAFKCQRRTIPRHCLVLDNNYLATKTWGIRCACFHGATLFSCCKLTVPVAAA